MIYKRYHHHTMKVNAATIRPPVEANLKNQLIEGNIEHLTMVSWPKGSSLNFLQEMDFIKSINISFNDPVDVAPINWLNKLEYFESSNRVSGKINFENFPNLKYLNFEYSEKAFENMSSLKNILELTVNGWPFEDLNRMAHLTKIHVLKLDFAKKMRTLSGIEKFNSLNTLELYSAPKLEELGDLRNNAATLKSVSFELVSKVSDFRVLDDLHNLEKLYIYRSAALHSVQFIKKLKNFRFAYIGTEVLDGDIEILKEKKIEYKKLKKYNSK